MYHKLPWKSCSGNTNMCIIFFGDTVSQGTFVHIYDVCPQDNFDKFIPPIPTWNQDTYQET